jgi:hypothetical protein
MAQAYNHLLLPLAPRRDKEIQIRWGVYAFARRFGREPEGLWLPETAVDQETLECAARQGVRFVILAPHQAQRVRAEGGSAFRPVSPVELDTRRPWSCPLPGGRSMACFFFDRALFEGICREGFAERPARLLEAWHRGAPHGKGALLAAADGEFFGHHNRHGVRGLAKAMAGAREEGLEFTIPARLLAEEGCAGEVEIAPRTSWSCPHGIARWQGLCDCRAGGGGGRRPVWKGQLRKVLEWLREEAARAWEERAAEWFADPAAALAEAPALFPRYPLEEREAFAARHGREGMKSWELAGALDLLESQRLSLFALTSCAFFFDDPAGIEPRQSLRCARRTAELLRPFTGRDLLPELERRCREPSA